MNDLSYFYISLGSAWKLGEKYRKSSLVVNPAPFRERAYFTHAEMRDDTV